MFSTHIKNNIILNSLNYAEYLDNLWWNWWTMDEVRLFISTQKIRYIFISIYICTEEMDK